ncbi:MAG TPA: DUF3267 domain-containing protein [Bacteroidaceae bacterium]|nr:DUF3267 domain-containing protein [Bacteroidaceae bacterium]
MVPGIEEIINSKKYKLREVLEFKDVISFVLLNIKKRGIVSGLYFFLNIASLAILIILSVVLLIQNNISAGKLIQNMILGILAGTFLIVPVHELFHYLAYFSMGARKIKFGADPRQFIFYVVADRFPIGRFQLGILAMTPFVAINALTALFIIPLFPAGTIIGGFLLLSHNIMCIGDFAMLNYALQKENKGVVTFDAVEKRKSYFFIKVKE